MNDALFSGLLGNSQEEILWKSTRRHLASLVPELEDAAYRCAIPHWFDEDILQIMLGIGHLARRGRSFQSAEPRNTQTLYQKLQTLPFVEEYPGRKHNFHDLTRQVVLEHLWNEEREFYGQISARLAEYYDSRVQRQEPRDWADIVEWAYHILIANEAGAIAEIDSVLIALNELGKIAVCRAILQAIEEHVAAHRLEAETQTAIRLWRAKIAFWTTQYDQVEQIVEELLTASNDSTPDWVKASARMILSASLHNLGRYEEARSTYLDAVEFYEINDSLDDMVFALLGLGRVYQALDAYNEAVDIYNQALGIYIPTLIRSDLPILVEKEPGGQLTTISDQDEPSSADLWVFNPDAWQKNENSYYIAGKQASNGKTEVNSDAHSAIYFYPVTTTLTVADSWYQLASLYEALDDYNSAVSCADLAYQIYFDYDDSSGTLQALQLLRRVGAATGNLKLIQTVIESLHAELNLARQQNNSRAELDALLALGAAHFDADQYADSRECYANALDQARTVEDILSEATAYGRLAEIDKINGAYETAENGFMRALELCRNSGIREMQAHLLLTLGDFKLARYKPDQAAEHYHTALELFTELDTVSGQFNALRGLGLAAQNQANHVEAITHFEHAVELARELHISSLEAFGLSNLAEAHRQQGNPQMASELYHQALELHRSMDRHADEADTLLALGDVAADTMELEVAAELYRQARTILAELQRPSGELRALFGIEFVYSRRAYLQDSQVDLQPAIQAAEEVLALARRLHDHNAELQSLVRLGLDYSAVERHNEAVELLEDVVLREPHDPSLRGSLGWVLYKAGDYDHALEISRAAFAEDPKQQWILRNIGLILLTLGRGDEAKAVYQQAIVSCYGNDNFKAAIKDIKDLLQHQPNTPPGTEILALLEQAQAELDAKDMLAH